MTHERRLLVSVLMAHVCYFALGYQLYMNCLEFSTNETLTDLDAPNYGFKNVTDPNLGLTFVRQWSCPQEDPCENRTYVATEPAGLQCFLCPETCIYADYVVELNDFFHDFLGRECFCRENNTIECSPATSQTIGETVESLCA